MKLENRACGEIRKRAHPRFLTYPNIFFLLAAETLVDAEQNPPILWKSAILHMSKKRHFRMSKNVIFRTPKNVIFDTEKTSFFVPQKNVIFDTEKTSFLTPQKMIIFHKIDKNGVSIFVRFWCFSRYPKNALLIKHENVQKSTKNHWFFFPNKRPRTPLFGVQKRPFLIPFQNHAFS